MPLLHTCPAPQLSPFIAFIVLSTHTGAPELHCVAPTLHTFGLPVQVAPTVHALHCAIALHTRLVPQLEPVVRLFGESTHATTPPVHATMPCLHALGFVLHALPAEHAMHM